MQKYKEIMKLFEEQEPFSFVRFNEGEMEGVQGVGKVVARGDQKVDNTLHQALIDALEYREDNYWIGGVCSVCFPEQYVTYREYLPEGSYEYETHAVVFINNKHWKRFLYDFGKYHAGRDIYWISGEDQNIELLQDYPDLNQPNIVEHIKVPTQNAWKERDKVFDRLQTFEKGSIVIMSCGPLSRIIGHKGWEINKEVTWFDSGAIFDPFTRDVWHRCHTGVLKYCPECNYSI